MIISIVYKNSEDNYKVDPEKKIIDTLKIIQENTNMNFDILNLEYVYSKRRKESINVDSSFIDSKIYNGDVLIVKGDRG